MAIVRKLRILSTGAYQPEHYVSAEALNQRLGKSAGWVQRKMNIEGRRYAGGESTSSMAVKAAKQALAGLEGVPDCIISAASAPEQALPTTAVLVQAGLGLEGMACFDINSTCLSFLTALDVASHFIELGSYRKVLIVSSEMPSLCLDWSDSETSVLFGDGAAAVVVGSASDDESSRCLAMRLRTFSEGATYCEIKGGGTANLAMAHPPADNHLFRMRGRAAFRLSADKMPQLIADVLADAGLALEDIQLIVPHQASAAAMAHMRALLGIPLEKVVDLFATHGNQVAASIPTALDCACRSGRLKRGDHAMIVGSAAGISLAAMVLRY